MTRARLVTAAVAAAVLLAGGVCGLLADGAPPAAAGGDGSQVDPRLVMVSGRDDHGMVALHRVPLYDEPGGDRTVAEVHDGTLAEVLATEGTWLQVRTVEGPPAVGWVDDFYLRGQARLVGAAPSCASGIDDTRTEGGSLVVVRELDGGRVLVETVTTPVVRGWALREDLQELPPQGADCGDVPPEDGGAHRH